MQLSHLFFAATLAISTFASPLAARDVYDGLDRIAMRANVLSQAITTYSDTDSSLDMALTIVYHMSAAEWTMKTTNTDIKATPGVFTPDEARQVLDKYYAFADPMTSFFNALTLQKPLFEAHGPEFIQWTLSPPVGYLVEEVRQLVANLGAKVPASHEAEFSDSAAVLAAAYNGAVQAYPQ